MMAESSDRISSRFSLASHSLSVLVPAFNEEKNLAPTVDRLLAALSITVEDFEIIIVDDGSSDGTSHVADEIGQRNPQVRVFHNPRNMGLGYCYLRGVQEALKGSFVYIPGDNTWPYRSFVDLFGNLAKADVITSYSTNPEVRTPVRRVVSAAYTRALNLLYGLRMRYYNGLTIYPVEFVQRNPPSTYGFGFQAEILLKAIQGGLSFVEVAIPIDERTAGGSKAVTTRNITSVVSTVLRTYWLLRLNHKRPVKRRGARAERTGTGDEQGAGRAGRGASAETVSAAGGSPARQRLRVIVTGASSGIGAALAEGLASDGHELFLCARDGERLDEVSRGGMLGHVRPCDVADETQVRDFTRWVGSLTPSVDALVNCAGSFGAIGPVEETDSAEWLSTLQVNVFGSYLMIKHVLPLLAGSDDPRILNFSGGGAFSPFPNYSAYACSKAAVVRLTECLAAELAPRGVAVNAVAPGFVATPAHLATLEAGPERAGSLYYRRTQAILANGGGEMGTVVDCVRTLLGPDTYRLTGKTISANFDPWRTTPFRERLSDIARSDLWTMRRMNILNLPESSLKTQLSEAWASHGTRR